MVTKMDDSTRSSKQSKHSTHSTHSTRSKQSKQSKRSKQSKPNKKRKGWKKFFGFSNKKTAKNQNRSDGKKTQAKEEPEPGLSKYLAETAVSPNSVENEHNKTSLGTCWDDFKDFCFFPMSVFLDEDESIQGCFSFPINIVNFVQKDLEGMSLCVGDEIRSECVQERDIHVQEEQVVHQDLHDNKESTMYEDAHAGTEHAMVEMVHPKGQEKEKDMIEDLEPEYKKNEQDLVLQIAEQREPEVNEKDQEEEMEGANELREREVDEFECLTLLSNIVGRKGRWSTLDVDVPATCISYPKRNREFMMKEDTPSTVEL